MDRFHRHHYFGGQCICACVLLFVISITLIGLLFTSIFGHTCEVDSDCGSDYCKTGSCVKGKCVYDRKENCCTSHEDCSNIACHTGLCNTQTHHCVLEQLPDHSFCDDNNKCTVQDKCMNGECVGNYACEDTQCTVAVCHPEQGCLHQKVANGNVCDDGSPCTIGDMCYNGVCASGIPKDCSSADGDCTLGTCSETNGDCLGAPRREGELCNDGLECTETDHCESGQCTGVQKTCEDNNPCVINLCIEGVGCMEHAILNSSNTSSCHSQCTDDGDCPGSYICHLGTCMNLIYDNPMYIRFIDYELDKCTNTSYRLVQHYFLDVQKRQVNQDIRYKVALNTYDFITHSTQPLGFPKFIQEYPIQTSINGNFSRTSFTLSTECQELNEQNCNILFANRNYEFSVVMYDCLYINGFNMENCIETGEQIGASIHLSIIDCPFSNNVHYISGSVGTLTFTNTSNVPKNIFDYRETVRVNLEVGYTPWIKDIIVCIVPEYEHMLECILNSNISDCPHLGCRGWTNSPLTYQAHLMNDGVLTSIARPNNIHTVTMCRNDEFYNQPEEECNHLCSYAEDGFDLNMKNFDDYMGQYVIFDVQYKNGLCTNSRRLSDESTRSIGWIKLVD